MFDLLKTQIKITSQVSLDMYLLQIFTCHIVLCYVWLSVAPFTNMV